VLSTDFCVVILVWLPPDPPWLVVFSCVASTRPVGVVSCVFDVINIVCIINVKGREKT